MSFWGDSSGLKGRNYRLQAKREDVFLYILELLRAEKARLVATYVGRCLFFNWVLAFPRNPWIPLAEPLGCAEPCMKNTDVLYCAGLEWCSRSDLVYSWRRFWDVDNNGQLQQVPQQMQSRRCSHHAGKLLHKLLPWLRYLLHSWFHGRPAWSSCTQGHWSRSVSTVQFLYHAH